VLAEPTAKDNEGVLEAGVAAAVDADATVEDPVNVNPEPEEACWGFSVVAAPVDAAPNEKPPVAAVEADATAPLDAADAPPKENPSVLDAGADGPLEAAVVPPNENPELPAGVLDPPKESAGALAPVLAGVTALVDPPPKEKPELLAAADAAAPPKLKPLLAAAGAAVEAPKRPVPDELEAPPNEKPLDGADDAPNDNPVP
jgi:hypothetical protein